MAGFQNCDIKKLSNNVPTLCARGGASMVTCNNEIIIVFGGANREQKHYNQIHVCVNKGDGAWKKVATQGDIPPPRSGQSMCQFGKYIFLFGGIDFENEAIYNDLYMLNTDTWDWKYVGEAGEEIPARNSHVLCLLYANGSPFLVLFGGASPELGPLGDTFYASLPREGISDERQPSNSTENTTEFFVTWKRVEGRSPCPREMFSASVLETSPLDSSLVISGGRTMDSILSDVWILSSTDSNTAKTPAEGESSTVSEDQIEEINFQWQQITSLELPHPRCAHTSAILPILRPSEELHDESSPAKYSLVLFGGFTGQGISDDIIQCVFHSINTPSSWQPVVSSQSIPGRFGHAMCIPPPWIRVSSSKKQNKLAALESSNYLNRNILVYGGVDAEQDYNDLWLLTLCGDI